MADAKRTAGGRDDPMRADGRYQVWHANDIEAVSLSGMEGEPYVHGFTRVAGVEARDLGHVLELTNHGDRPWWENPEVKAPVLARSTTTGDVIVDPRGHAYRVEGRLFIAVEAASHPLPSPADLVERAGPPSPRLTGERAVKPRL